VEIGADCSGIHRDHLFAFDCTMPRGAGQS
jgi:hypothetical protein